MQLPAQVQSGDRAMPASASANVSRAYRVNLTVLALVALFTGAFLVFSILSLSRSPSGSSSSRCWACSA
jgi:putative ABC transport system permease protein